MWKLILIKDNKIFIILPEGGSKVTIRSWVKICKKNPQTQQNTNQTKRKQKTTANWENKGMSPTLFSILFLSYSLVIVVQSLSRV